MTFRARRRIDGAVVAGVLMREPSPPAPHDGSAHHEGHAGVAPDHHVAGPVGM